MKTIKLLSIVLLSIIYVSGISQKKFEIDVSNPTSSTLELVNLAGDLKVVTGNSNKLIVEADGIEPVPERAKGLKRIGSGGEDNTGIGLNYTKKGDEIKLFGAASLNSGINYKVILPKGLKIRVELGIYNHGDINIEGLSSDIELDVKNSDIKLTNVTGPTVISTFSGDIDIIFSKVSQSSPFSIKALSADIDISLPSNTPANLELSSMSGGIYTDFDIQSENKDAGDLKHVGGSTKVRAKINGGGVKLAVSTMSGDIFLRKKK